MKAKDLMIGDWLCATDDDGNKHLCRVASVEYDSTNDRDDYTIDFNGTGYSPEWPDVLFDCEPIPLTHDIIKANGFELTEVGDNGIATPKMNLNRYEKHECKTKWRDITMWYDRMTKKWCLHGVNSIQLNYVHELQHALRLCGIDKEMKLEG